MAILFKTRKNQQEQINQSGQAGLPQYGTDTSTPAPATPTSASTNVQQEVNAPKEKSRSGNFVNLSNYLNANQGSGIASGIAKGMQRQGQAIESGTTAAQQEYATNQAQGLQAANAASQALTDTLSNLPKATPQQIQTASQAGQAEYAGPTQLNITPASSTDVEQAKQQAELAQSTGGRQALLGQKFGDKNYTAGQRRLDQALMQSDLSGINQLRESQADIDKAARSREKAISDSILSTKQVQDYIKNQRSQDIQKIADSIKGTNESYLANIGTINQQREGAQKQALEHLSKGYLTADEANQFGLTGTKTTTPGRLDLYGVDLTSPEVQALFKRDEALNAQTGYDIKTAQKINILNQLAGNSILDPATQDLLNQYKGYTVVNPTDSTPYTFDLQALKGLIEGRKSEYNTALTPLQDTFRSAADALTDTQRKMLSNRKILEQHGITFDELGNPDLSHADGGYESAVNSRIMGSYRPAGNSGKLGRVAKRNSDDSGQILTTLPPGTDLTQPGASSPNTPLDPDETVNPHLDQTANPGNIMGVPDIETPFHPWLADLQPNITNAISDATYQNAFNNYNTAFANLSGQSQARADALAALESLANKYGGMLQTSSTGENLKTSVPTYLPTGYRK